MMAFANATINDYLLCLINFALASTTVLHLASVFKTLSDEKLVSHLINMPTWGLFFFKYSTKHNVKKNKELLLWQRVPVFVQ